VWEPLAQGIARAIDARLGRAAARVVETPPACETQDCRAGGWSPVIGHSGERLVTAPSVRSSRQSQGRVNGGGARAHCSSRYSGTAAGSLDRQVYEAMRRW
jgi:hypothetical protein